MNLKTKTNVASPADKDSVIKCAKQIQLKKYTSFTDEHICQLDLQATVDYSSLSAGDADKDGVINCAEQI